MKKEIEKILKKIEAKGFKAYLVGGYVRDYLLGIKTFDVDIATNALPKDLLKIFKEAKFDENYGSIKIFTNKYKFDITTLRKEEYVNGHLKITYIDSVELDAKRRDFTINAIYMDINSNIIDPMNGLNDIQKGIIKVIGKTSARFIEDPLRILRAIRLKVQLNFKLDKEIIDYIKENPSLINKISIYRKKEELDKIFSLKEKLTGLNILKNYNLLKPLGINYKEVIYTEEHLGIWSQLDYKDYPFTKEEKKIIQNIRKIDVINNYNVYKYGLYVSLVASSILNVDKKQVNDIYKKLPIKDKKDIKIKFDKLIKLGYKKEEINDIIKKLEKAIVNFECKNNYKDIVKYLKGSEKIDAKLS